MTNRSFNSARNFTLPRDPLVLDLDGDGLELQAASGNILFDHDADGIKTGTGWASADDGFLVRDLNGNGLIDSGQELFGEDTIKRNGQLARQGFDALADLDSNTDGHITNADAAWSELQVWRDLNQDGISQSHELSSLDALNITRIGVSGTSSGPQAGQTIQNNRVALSTTFTQGGADRTIGAIDLDANPFFSDIPAEQLDEAGNPVSLTEAALALPQMNGSGMVRNLRAAVSQSGAAADELEAALTAFASATTRDAQRAALDGLITEWAQTSSYWSELESYLGGSVIVNPPVGMSKAEYRNLVAVLEAFNGSRFYGGVGQPMPTGQSASTVNGATQHTITPPTAQAVLLQQAYGALKESVYNALVVQTRLKPYLDAIELRIDDSGLSFDTTAMAQLLQQRYEESPQHGVEDLVELVRYADPSLRAVDFNATAMLRDWSATWPGDSAFTALLGELDVFTGSAMAGGTRNDIYVGNAQNNVFLGHEGDDLLDGGEGDDTLFGGNGNDVHIGGAGNDTLHAARQYGGGHVGAVDVLDGGPGNDFLEGGFGSQTYLFGRGDGQDTITNLTDTLSGAADTTAGKQDVLQFKAGIAPSDVTLSRLGGRLIIQLNNGTDQVTVESYFEDDGASPQGYALDAIRFEDGTSWSPAQVKDMVLRGTDRNDMLTGYAADDTIDGGAGDDRIYAQAGHDVLFGGLGHDRLYGQDGNDTLDGGEGDDLIEGDNGDDTAMGGEGNDMLYGGKGNDVIVGGAGSDSLYPGGNSIGSNEGASDVLDGGTGNDYLRGDSGSQTFLFGRGDGRDIISNHSGVWDTEADATTGAQDVLQFKAGIAASDVTLGRDGNDLIVQLLDSTDAVKVQNYFGHYDGSRYGYGLNAIRFDDGTSWSMAHVKAMVLQGSDGKDRIVGYASADVIDGRGGDDEIRGEEGDDQISGGEGNDMLTGGHGNDFLDGGEGQDTLWGGPGSDVLIGGAGDDHLYAKDSHGGGPEDAVDVLDGGTGNDFLHGGFGSQTYLFGRGDGQDTISNLTNSWGGVEPSTSKQDVLQFKAGIAPGDATLSRSGDDLIVRLNGSTDQVTVQSYFLQDGASPKGFALDAIRFDDGTSWNLARVKDMLLRGADGDDTVLGYASDDTLTGGAGDDILLGGAGANIFEGGQGNDVLVVSGSQEELLFQRGDGQDVVAAGWSSLGEADSAEVRIRLQGVSSPDALGLTLEPGNSRSVFLTYGDQDRIELRNGNTSRAHWAKTLVVFDDGPAISLLDLATSHIGSDQNDVIHAPAFAVTLRGGAGDDVFQAGDVSNVFEGGTGNDVLNGTATYRFADGWGHDVLRPGSSGTTTLDFSGALTSTDVVFSRYIEGAAGTSWTPTTTPMIRIESLKDGSSVVMPAQYAYRLQFSDKSMDLVNGEGVAYDGADTLSLPGYLVRQEDGSTPSADGSYRVLDGQGGDDTLDSRRWRRVSSNQYVNENGAWFDEAPYWLKGGDGNDTLYGAHGDTLEGGRGSDLLVQHGQTGMSSPTVVKLSLGDGKDTWTSNDHNHSLDDTVFEFAGNVDPASVRAEWIRTALTVNAAHDLVLHYGDQGDSVTLVGVESLDQRGREITARLRFADGTETLLHTAIAPAGITPETAGDDVILGTLGLDVIGSGEGNDRIVLDDGDTYVYRLGHGHDVIDTSRGSIQLADITDASRVKVERTSEGTLANTVNTWRITFADREETLQVRFKGVEHVPQLLLGDGKPLPLRALPRVGTEGYDSLTGGSGHDDLYGLGGDDGLTGGAGNDVLVGGRGNDTLRGGEGDDVYVYERGDGTDWVDADDPVSSVDTLRFGAGILESDVSLVRQGYDLEVRVRGDGGWVWVREHFWPRGSDQTSDRKLDRIEFATGAVWDLPAIDALINTSATNQRPVFKGAIPLLKAQAGSTFSYTVPANTIVDPNPWDAVNYYAKMPDGSALPAWVSFDALTRTLTARPEAAHVGTLQFALWGKDAFGYGTGQYVTLQVGAAAQPAAASAPEALAAAWPQAQAPTAVDLGDAADVAPAADASNRESVAAALPQEATAAPSARILGPVDFEARNAALWRDFGDTVGLSAYHIQRQADERAREAARWVTPAPLAAASSGSALERQAQINTQVDLMIQAMAAFGAPPPMGLGSYRAPQLPPGAFFPPIAIGPN